MERPKNICYQLHKTCAFPKFVTAFSTFLEEDMLYTVEDNCYVCTTLWAGSLCCEVRERSPGL